MTTAKTPAKPSPPAPAAPPIPMPPYKLNKLEIRSQEVWQEAYAAIAAVAQRRGWPCDTDDDIKQVIDQLDAESGEERRQFWLSSQAAWLFHDNVRFGFMDRSEFNSTYKLVKKFIARLEAV